MEDSLSELKLDLDGKDDPRLATAKALFLASKLRHRHFGTLVASAQSWDILLCLYILDAEPVSPRVSRVIEMAGGPMTTALRVLGRFERAGLIVRRRIPEDGRVVTLALTAKAKRLLRGYLKDAMGPERAVT